MKVINTAHTKDIVKYMRKYKKYIHHRYFIGAVIISTVLIILSFTLLSTTVFASSPSDNVKVIKSVKIEAGDTLWSIAKEYITDEYKDIRTYIKEIKKTNGLTDDIITEGCYIIVPYYVSSLE